MIEFNDVTYRYENRAEALTGISLKIEQGEKVALVGGNGSGKTTLALMLNGILKPSEGVVSVCGLNPSDEEDASRLKRKVGLVFQNPDNQLVSTTVERELAFTLENMNMDRAEMQIRVNQTLEQYRLSDMRDRLTATLSGGEKQKLALASVMIARPEVLVLDEPDSYLDEAGRILLEAALETMIEETPELTLLRITQFGSIAERYGRIIALHRGEIAGDDSPEELFEEGRRLYSTGIDVPFNYRLKDGAEFSFESDGSPKLKKAGLKKIVLRNISFAYPGANVDFRLQNLDLAFEGGRVYGLVGPSGSGKSSLMQIAAGLLKPQKGAIEYFPAKPKKGQVAAVFQEPERQFFLGSVDKELRYGPGNIGISNIDAKLDEVYYKINLPRDEFAERNPQSLSGGEKRRLAFGTVLTLSPDFIFFDEPTCGLDTRGIAFLKYIINDLKAEGGCAVIISHSGDIIFELADEVIELINGEVTALEETLEYFENGEYGAFLSKPGLAEYQEKKYGRIRHRSLSDLSKVVPE